MLVLYQLFLKYAKCQYGELTVSLLFSAQENTRHAHRASLSRNLKQEKFGGYFNLAVYSIVHMQI